MLSKRPNITERNSLRAYASLRDITLAGEERPGFDPRPAFESLVAGYERKYSHALLRHSQLLSVIWNCQIFRSPMQDVVDPRKEQSETQDTTVNACDCNG